MNLGLRKKSAYTTMCFVILIVLSVLMIFPLYWIITGSLKTFMEINAASPTWFPKEFTSENYENLLKTKDELWNLSIKIPFSGGATIKSVGPTVPRAVLWLFNTVIMSVGAMVLTCITASMAGYVLAKKRFWGRGIVFGLIVCAMALPKQVILVPLLKEMEFLKIHDTLWSVIFPTVGWPFGVFLLKQFSESIPGEMLEAARIDGASEARVFTQIVIPMIKPGIGALAIFTFINSWNDYFMQLIMLNSMDKLTISLGIAKMQVENATDFGLIMAGAALAAIPIITVFLIFQKYFTQGITMGAVKG